MLLTITTTHQPATDLGYLLHKHPGKCQSFDLAFGQAHVFYPEATEDRCTAALLLDIDPIGLVRGRGGSYFALADYVNDRPYAASSFLSVAISKVYSTAISGICKSRPGLVQTPIPLEATITALPCRGGEDLLRRLFEPLGYAITAVHHPLDPAFPEWGESRYFTVMITGTVCLSDLLSHLYVLIPVLDDEKHYWVGDDEVQKLLRHGEGWLSTHPERKLIADRYLKHRGGLVRSALDQLEAETAPEAETEATADAEEEAVERPISLNEQRLDAVVMALMARGVKRVLDLGCGEGNLIRKLMEQRSFSEILGMDVSYRVLERAMDRLKLDRMPPMQRKRLSLIQGSLMYRATMARRSSR
jgi:3' terminal RNA ribose 2'-O-methyltransferase Hen1